MENIIVNGFLISLDTEHSKLDRIRYIELLIDYCPDSPFVSLWEKEIDALWEQLKY